MFFEEDYSKREIIRIMDVSSNFVVKWTQSENQDFEKDDRGWEKGKRRKWDEEIVDRIVRIRQELEEDEEADYWGPSAVEVQYRRQFPDLEVPPLRTIGQILKDRGMTKDQKHSTKRGALRYLRYPERTIYEKIGGRVLEADFIGGRYLTGRSEPLHFLGYSFKREPKLRHYEHIQAQTTREFINTTEAFFNRFERPDVVKMDNDTATIGGGVHKRAISQVMQFLMRQKVYPVYSVPRQPATQASIEGSNSLFSRKFWNRHEFEDVEEMEERLEVFNENTRKYLRYDLAEREEDQQSNFEPTVYFLRQVRETEEEDQGFVKVMNEKVRVPREYIKFFVMGEWDLRDEKLSIRFEEKPDDEQEGVQSRVLKERKFPIHEVSRERCKEIL